MPELPEVETIRCSLLAALADEPNAGGPASAVEQSSTQDLAQSLPRSFLRLQGWYFGRKKLRYPVPIAELQKLQGHYLLSVERRGKYLLLYFGSEPRRRMDYWVRQIKKLGPQPVLPLSLTRIIVHLGMSGILRLLNHAPSELAKHDHLYLQLRRHGQGGANMQDYYLLYNDARRFGFWSWENCLGQRDEFKNRLGLAKLGPEPLSEYVAPLSLALEPAAVVEDLGAHLYQASRNLRGQLKPWLLAGKAVCGVGNIYCSESLWLAKLSPFKESGQLSRLQAASLALAVKQTMGAAIAAGGTTLKDFRSVQGRPGYFQRELHAYGKEGEPCPRPDCAGKIAKVVQGQRATYYCPKCQE